MKKVLRITPLQTKLNSYRYTGKYLQIPLLPITLILVPLKFQLRSLRMLPTQKCTIGQLLLII